MEIELNCWNPGNFQLYTLDHPGFLSCLDPAVKHHRPSISCLSDSTKLPDSILHLFGAWLVTGGHNCNWLDHLRWWWKMQHAKAPIIANRYRLRYISGHSAPFRVYLVLRVVSRRFSVQASSKIKTKHQQPSVVGTGSKVSCIHNIIIYNICPISLQFCIVTCINLDAASPFIPFVGLKQAMFAPTNRVCHGWSYHLCEIFTVGRAPYIFAQSPMPTQIPYSLRDNPVWWWQNRQGHEKYLIRVYQKTIHFKNNKPNNPRYHHGYSNMTNPHFMASP